MIDDSGHAPFQRQLNEYFNAWTRAVQQACGPAAGGLDGLGAAAGGPWLQAIHQLARQALEQGLDSAGIAAAWRQILQQGLWPDAMPPGNAPGANPWAWPPGAGAWLDQPAFGPMREHLERWQQQARQQQQGQGAFADWQALMTRVRERALEQFEQLLRHHEQHPLADARALLDLWVEAAEQAWQQVAMSEEFARLLGQLNQTQMQLLQARQDEAERLYAGLGIASRRELDQAYARIDALERQVRQLLAMSPAAAGNDGKARRAGTRKAGSTATRPAVATPDTASPRRAGSVATAKTAAAASKTRKASSAAAAPARQAKADAGIAGKRAAGRTDKG